MRKRFVEIEINPIRCDGCAMCVAVCPNNVLKVKDVEGYPCAVTIWSIKCTGCGRCASICNKKAIEIEAYRLEPAIA